MFTKLPTLIDPERLALDNTHLQGPMPLAQMQRLGENLYDRAGNVDIDWWFFLDDQHRANVTGRLEAQLPLQCQRCLERMYWPVNLQVALTLLLPGQSEDLVPLTHEVITLTQTPVALETLIEDELILALPIVAKHEECPFNDYQLPEDAQAEFKHQSNPFQILKKLKK
ncbi:MAG: YceD family protein [Pseudomonadota bacterium]|nr:YceD family protein [Pseudomonadota bacterium]